MLGKITAVDSEVVSIAQTRCSGMRHAKKSVPETVNGQRDGYAVYKITFLPVKYYLLNEMASHFQR